MKTNLFKKSSQKTESKFIEMSKEELQTIQGGAEMYYYIDKNGRRQVLIVLEK